MNLTSREKDKLLVSVAAMVAARRLERGVKLNYPEAIALITDYVLEGARAVQARSAVAGMQAGVTAVGGLLIARWLAVDALTLRRAYADLACHLRAAAMGLPPRLPRLWHV